MKMTVVKMNKTISRPRKKGKKEHEKDFDGFMKAAIHMEHVARDFAQHIEDFGMEPSRFRSAPARKRRLLARFTRTSN